MLYLLLFYQLFTNYATRKIFFILGKSSGQTGKNMLYFTVKCYVPRRDTKNGQANSH